VDKATAETLPYGGENLELNFEISDCIRSKTVPAKEAMRSIKRRVNHKNPNVQLFALTLADTCVKNGGDHFLVEVASREFMDNLVSILKIPGVNSDVKQKILRLIQNWALAFESKTGLGYATEVYKALQKDGFSFPPKDVVAASAAMVDTKTPPEWIDSDVCLRCRTPFSFTNRKHHCRSCGLVFDQQCSSKVMALPHLGIMQPVRVCDSCFIKAGRTKTAPFPEEPGAPSRLSRKLSRRVTEHLGRKSADELMDEELQRAIQLSLEEAGLREQHGPRRTEYATSPISLVSEPPMLEIPATNPADDDPELHAAIEASLREANAPKPSAPVADESATRSDSHVSTPAELESSQNFDLNPFESDAILTFSQTIEAAHARGVTDLVRQQGVNELYDRANGARPKLVRSLDDTGRKEQLLAEMNEKLSQAARLYDHLLTTQVSSPTLYNSTPALGRPYQTQSFHNTVSSSTQYSYPQTLLQYPASWETSTPRQEPHVPGLSPQTYSNTNDYISSAEQLQSLTLRETPPVQTYHPISQATAGDFTSSMSSPHIPLPLSSPPIVSQQQAPVKPAPHSFPIFPSVPTAPLPSPAYRAPVEQKEAMLISFD
ncbi:hypothetical protein BS47DRAFT_1422197, partial [Hydnum rufescens UP504]